MKLLQTFLKMKGPTYLIVITLIFLSINTYSQSHKKVKFTPTHYYSFFSGATSPVLSIYPGDTIITSSVDCEGFDRNLKLCTSGKSVNPLTGPFYISGAEEGDIVKITFTDIRFSRNTAFSLPYFHPRSMNDSIAQLANNDSLPIIWDLNFKKNIFYYGNCETRYFNQREFLKYWKDLQYKNLTQYEILNWRF